MEFAYVGSYTTPKRGGLGSGGISVFSRTSAEEPWKEEQIFEIMNPSFLCFARGKRNLYAVRADGDIVTAFAVDEKTGRLAYLNEKHIGFDNGVFVTADAQSRFLFVASPGGVVSIRLNDDGSLGELCDIVVPKGDLGPLGPGQRRGCSHQICFDREGRYLIEPNKGFDQLNTYEVDQRTGCMTQVASAKMPQSCCPRHIAFHPTLPVAYLLTEWIGRVISCRYENGSFTPFEILPTTPKTFVGLRNVGAEIAVHPSGRFVYTSNRGYSSIAVFKVTEDGGLESVSWTTEGVAKPRFFTLSPDGKQLYCANEESHSVTLYDIDESTGALTFVDTVMRASAPACVLFKVSEQ